MAKTKAKAVRIVSDQKSEKRAKRRAELKDKLYRRYKKGMVTIGPHTTQPGFPNAIYGELAYVQHIQIASSTITPGTQTFRLNSLFDPDFSGIGSQPYMRDQWAALYSKYVVYACRVQIHLSTDNANNDILVTARPTQSSLTIGDIDLEMERGGISRVVANERPQTISLFIPLHKIWGISKKRYMSDDLYSQNTIGSNPLSPVYYTLGAIAADRGTTVSVQCQVKLTQYFKMYHYKQAGAS